jgi:hypothetical protein
MKLRREIVNRGGVQPPIGLLEPGTWRDVAPLVVVFADGSRISVQIKHLTDCDNVGLVRIKFPSQVKWLAGGVFGVTPRLAISEARHHLINSYFPGQLITLA